MKILITEKLPGGTYKYIGLPIGRLTLNFGKDKNNLWFYQWLGFGGVISASHGNFTHVLKNIFGRYAAARRMNAERRRQGV